MPGCPDAREGEQRHRQIDAAAKAAFLASLRDGLCREDAAAAAGFSLTGFYGARYRDPAFAADWQEALALPPAAGRRALAYAERGEVRIASSNRRLLQRRRRRNVRCPESNFIPGGGRQAWTFERAIVELDKALDALARKTGKPRPHEGKEGEGLARETPLPAEERDRFAKRTRVRACRRWRAQSRSLTLPPLRGSLPLPSRERGRRGKVAHRFEALTPSTSPSASTLPQARYPPPRPC